VAIGTNDINSGCAGRDMKRAIAILLWADMWATFAASMIGPIYAIFIGQIGGDLLDASWAYFSFMITGGLGMYLISKWEDRVKHKEKLLFLGYALGSLGLLSYVFVDSKATLIITQIILGISEAIIVPAWDAFYVHYLNRSHEGSEWTNWTSSRYVATAISVLIGGYIAATMGFKALFIVMFLLSLMAGFASLKLFRNPHWLGKDVGSIKGHK